MRAGLFVDIVSSLIKVPIGFIMAFWYVLNVRPDVVVSFGGYIAVPVVLAAWILAIPIITHEQTHTIGLGTKIIAFLQTLYVSATENKCDCFLLCASCIQGYRFEIVS